MGVFILWFQVLIVCLLSNISLDNSFFATANRTTTSTSIEPLDWFNITSTTTTTWPIFIQRFTDDDNIQTNITTTEYPCSSVVLDKVIIMETSATEAIALLIFYNVYPNVSSNTCVTDVSVKCAINADITWDSIYPISVDSSLQQNITLSDLLEYTNYICMFSMNETNISKQANFTTQDVAPRNLKVFLLSPFSFKILWSSPSKNVSYPSTYNITIIRHDVGSENHFLGNCSTSLDNFNFTNMNGTTNFTFEEALPDFNYTIEVRALFNAGLGREARTSCLTNISASEEPRNIGASYWENMTNRNIEMYVELLWSMPCNTNGPVKYFVIDISGVYRENYTLVENYSFTTNITDSSYKFSLIVSNLMAASNYSVEIFATVDPYGQFHGEKACITFSTPDNLPDIPNNATVSSVSPYTATLMWNLPSNNPGLILQYQITINYFSLDWFQTPDCFVEKTNRSFNTTDEMFTVDELIPATIYNVTIAAQTSRGFGNPTNFSFISNSSVPDPFNVSTIVEPNVINQTEYDVTGGIRIFPGCFYGQIFGYFMSAIGNRENYLDLNIEQNTTNLNETSFTFDLSPEYTYSLNVTIIPTTQPELSKSTQFSSPAGVPNFDIGELSNIEFNISTTQASLTLHRRFFNSSKGSLRFIAIIVSNRNITSDDEYYSWDISQWPELQEEDGEIYYQATPQFWNPFLNDEDDNDESVDFILGNNESCAANEQFCNRPLMPATTYFIYIRMFNSAYYRTTMPLLLVTEALSTLAFVLGLTFGLLALCLTSFAGFFLWRKGIIRKYLSKVKSTTDTGLSKEKFVDYCERLERDSDVLAKEWQDLQAKSEEIYKDYTTHFALLPENKRKNRYTNILPFDHSRVKLNIDEDDEICSDYINASFIKGFSTKEEYIATQGPLPHTARDFWKMVFQENVTMIVMVTRLIEEKREKCFKYFPNNHESMIFGEDIEVRCSLELNFDIYCLRILQVRKDLKQVTVTHMQFLNWPDFGIPHGTENLLVFCHQFRNRWKSEGGMAVIHCSAGVGRTGTIMALDILVQALEAGEKLDVAKTVLELRRQRKSMVQSQTQYFYIYQLLRSTIEDPLSRGDEIREPIYANIQQSSSTPGIAIAESAF
ncbi:hypothetical protein ABEB36_005272 [Hypothenemus hampei]|uniref:Protein-tyrosine-phosphatase n=1 Tax=Hypothenemus hampei TaxID=57062 RepID=A0ABD1EXM6_HYPHA